MKHKKVYWCLTLLTNKKRVGKMAIIETLTGWLKWELLVAGGIGGIVRSYVNRVKQPGGWIANALIGAVLGYFWSPMLQAILGGDEFIRDGLALFLGIMGVDFIMWVKATWQEVAEKKLAQKLGSDK